jgi:hypothetical protein
MTCGLQVEIEPKCYEHEAGALSIQTQSLVSPRSVIVIKLRRTRQVVNPETKTHAAFLLLNLPEGSDLGDLMVWTGG